MRNTVRVTYRHEPEGWWAKSPDIEGWSAAGDSYAEVQRLVCEGVRFALGRDVLIEHDVPAGERLSA